MSLSSLWLSIVTALGFARRGRERNGNSPGKQDATSGTTAACIRLPTEILSEIFRRLGDRSRLSAFYDSNTCQYYRNYAHLLRVSKVNHSWRSAVIIVLYEEVILDYESSVLNFARTLAAHPEYGALVRRLSLPAEMRQIVQDQTPKVRILRAAVERILEGCCNTIDVALPLSDVNTVPWASHQAVQVTSTAAIVGLDRTLNFTESRVRRLTLLGSSPSPQKLALALPISGTPLSRAFSRLTSLSLVSVFIHQPGDDIFELPEPDMASVEAVSDLRVPALRALRHLHITYGLVREPPLANLLHNAPGLESVEIGCTRLTAPSQWNIANTLRPHCADNLKYLRVFNMSAFLQVVEVGILSGFTALRSLTLDHVILAAAVFPQWSTGAAQLEPPPGLEELVVLLSGHHHHGAPPVQAFNLLSTVSIVLRTWYQASLTPRLRSVEVWSEINMNSLPWSKWILSSFLLREHVNRAAPDVKVEIYLQIEDQFKRLIRTSALMRTLKVTTAQPRGRRRSLWRRFF